MSSLEASWWKMIQVEGINRYPHQVKGADSPGEEASAVYSSRMVLCPDQEQHAVPLSDPCEVLSVMSHTSFLCSFGLRQ